MEFRGTRLGRLALAVGALLAMAARSEAQLVGPMGPGGPNAFQFAPQGYWAEVLTVTPQWLVLQNQQGQQFPVDLNAEPRFLFLMRWPTSPDRFAPDAWAEAFGFNGNSNRLLTDHVDVYQGATRTLFAVPQRDSFNERGEFVFPLLLDTYETGFGDDFRRQPQDTQPMYLHVVGPVVNRIPLVVGLPDNTQVTVLGPRGNPPMTLVTFGSPTFVRRGDVVWYLPTGAGPRSLTLAQLWVYKTIPLDQYAP